MQNILIFNRWPRWFYVHITFENHCSGAMNYKILNMMFTHFNMNSLLQYSNINEPFDLLLFIYHYLCVGTYIWIICVVVGLIVPHPPRHVHLEAVNVTLFVKRILADVIKDLEMRPSKLDTKSNDKCP